MTTPRGIVSVEQALTEMGLLEEHLLDKIDIKSSKLSGGLTNDNILVRLPCVTSSSDTAATKKIVLRRFSSKTSHHLSYNRDDEYRNSSLAAKEKGIGAQVLGYTKPTTTSHGGALALDFIEGSTMDEDSMKQLCSSLDGVQMVVSALKKLHQTPSLFENVFDPFEARKTYEEQVKHLTTIAGEEGRVVEWPNFSTLVDRLAPIQTYLQSAPEPLVDCHNDLLSANFIRSTDGQHLTIVDWELSGRAEPCWDIGNFISENGLGNEDNLIISQIVSLYWHGSSDDFLKDKIKRVKMYSIVSKITWAAWGAVLHNLAAAADTTIDFDYAEWSIQKLQRAEKELAEHCID